MSKDELGEEVKLLQENSSDDLEDTKSPGLLKKIFPTGFTHEAKSLSRLIPGLLVCQICQWMVQPIVIMFGGHLGKIELDAIGLACSIINVLGYSLIYGASGVCDIAFSHTYGGKNKKMIGVYLQRCMIILMLALLPCYALHINIEGILLVLGQEPSVCKLVGRYMLIFIPGSLCMFLYIILQRYCICQDIVNHDIWMGLVAHAIHAGLQYLFLYQLNMGVDGSAIAQACFFVISVIMRLVLLICSKKVRESWGGWSVQCFGGWGPLSRLAFASGMMMCAEWWAYEVSTLLAGLLGTTELGAQAVIFNIMVVITAVAVAPALAGMIRMGHHLGAGNPQAAITTERVTFVISFINAVFWLILLLVFQNYIGMMFTGEQDVLDIINGIMPILAIYCFSECFTILGRHVFRVATKQKIGAIIIFVTYFLFSMPIGYCLMFLTDLELYGLWLGFTLCTTGTAVAMTVISNFFFDWGKISEEAQVRACNTEEVMSYDTEKDNFSEKDRISENKKGYGTVEVDKIKSEIKEDLIASWKSSTTSHMEAVLKDEPENVTRAEIIKCCIIIAVFFLVLIIGIVVRLSTQGLIDDFQNNANQNGKDGIKENVTDVYPTESYINIINGTLHIGIPEL